MNQQYDMNTFSGVIDARIMIMLKKPSENSPHMTETLLGDLDSKIIDDKLKPSEQSELDYFMPTSTLSITEDPFIQPTFQAAKKIKQERRGGEVESRVSKPLCELCGQVFHQQRTYAKHMLLEHGETVLPTISQRIFTCSKCQREFPARHLLQKHEMEHKGFYFKCTRCKGNNPLKFPSYSQLRTHYLMVHMAIKCKHCAQVCYGRSHYTDHLALKHSEHKAEKGMKGEVKKYTCDTCKHVFFHAVKYQEHLMFQKNNMCFVCPVCEKGMKNRKCLKYHMTTHGVGKRKQCDVCDNTFAQNSALVQHIRMNHPDVLPHKYRGDVLCDICQKAFRTRGALVSHKITCHEELMKKCVKCSRPFTSSAALSNHLHHCN